MYIKCAIIFKYLHFLLQLFVDVTNVLFSQFSDEVEYVDDCYNDTMMPASHINKRKLQQLIDNIQPNEKANFTLAFEVAFNLLNIKVNFFPSP